jgi:hypothetical protein
MKLKNCKIDASCQFSTRLSFKAFKEPNFLLKPGSSSSNKARRQQELSAISDWIDANNPIEKDLIVLGDMNLNKNFQRKA